MALLIALVTIPFYKKWIWLTTMDLSLIHIFAAKAELVRVRLQIEMMMKLEKYYRQGTFL